jgi:hypothetical protein
MVMVEKARLLSVEKKKRKKKKWGEKKGKSIKHRINGVMDKPRMQQGPRFDVTRKGNRVPTYELLYEQYSTMIIITWGLQERTHRTKPDVNWVGGTTVSPNSLREMGAWKAAITHAETNHTFASAKTFPGHSLKIRMMCSCGMNERKRANQFYKNLPPPKAENKVSWVRLVGFFPILIHKPLRIE